MCNVVNVEVSKICGGMYVWLIIVSDDVNEEIKVSRSPGERSCSFDLD